MKVKDLVLYQIATDRYYKVGDKLTFGKELNFQGQRVLNGAKLENRCSYDDGYDYLDSKLKIKSKDLILKYAKYLEEYDFITRELAFEKVRKEKYSQYPSRLTCMYLTDNKDACISNLKKFHNKGHGTFFQAIAVKLNGNIFYSTVEHVSRDGLPFNSYIEKAEKYWAQPQNTNIDPNEILFEGTAEVIEIFEEYIHKR